jgi:STE24 endopeptidase
MPDFIFVENIMMEKLFLYMVTGFIVFEFIIERWLDYLNLKHWKNEIPSEMEGFIDTGRYHKIQEYEKAKKRLSAWSSSLQTFIILALLFTKGFGWLYEYVSGFTESEYLRTIGFFALLSLANSIISLPFGIYHTFVIEEKFGFNRYTVRLYITDKIKALVLGALLGGSIICMLLFFYLHAGKWFWLYAWIAVALISLFFITFYTSLIVPLFNKLTPLQEGSLKQKLEAYSQKVKFPLKNIMVMDGSKRSAKSNAYFSGIGPKKTIVLFDTLINQHTEDELVAIIAHEVGHYKKKHILKNYILSFIQMAVLFYLLGLAFNEPAFSRMLGAKSPNFALGLIGFVLLYQPVSFFTGIMMNILSRKYEFEADAFAKQTHNAEALSNALKKLSASNLSNFIPHPLYVFVYYSHPPLLERLKALK